MRRAVALAAGCALALGAPAVFAQGAPQGYPQYGQPAPQQPYGQQQAPYGQQQAPYGQQQGYAPSQRAPSRPSSMFELGTLYATSVGYGVGLGIWLDAEIGIEDPGVLLIPPSILGLAAPIGVYFLDDPSMPRGKPAAIAAGLAIGAAEGLGVASAQFVASDEDSAWGFRGLSRSMAIGATVGGVGGYFMGEYQEPSPKSSALMASGTLWGTAVGSALGYGISPEGGGFARSNDYAAIAGLIGLNVGLGASAAASLVAVPSWAQIQGMWIGAGIGAAASLPVFLFYAGDDNPPAKRGLVFSATAVTLGIAAGAIFAPGDSAGEARSASTTDVASAGPSPFASITQVTPFTTHGGGGLTVGGVLY